MDGIPGHITTFTLRPGDKFCLADGMAKRGRELTPEWMAGLGTEYNGTVQQFFQSKVPKLLLHLVVTRFHDTFISVEPEPEPEPALSPSLSPSSSEPDLGLEQVFTLEHPSALVVYESARDSVTVRGLPDECASPIPTPDRKRRAAAAPAMSEDSVLRRSQRRRISVIRRD